jgi:hypothetical protein
MPLILKRKSPSQDEAMADFAARWPLWLGGA